MHDNVEVCFSIAKPTKITLFMKLFSLNAANNHHVIMALIEERKAKKGRITQD